MHKTSLTLFKVRGIPIRAHWSLLLLLAYLAYAFSHQFAHVAEGAGVTPGDLAVSPLLIGVVLAVGLLVSLALHELAHSVVAVRLGGTVADITLMLVGGMSRIGHMPRRKWAEALVAAVGPLANLVIASVLILAHGALTHGAADARMGLFYLAQANLALAIFNLLPALPMDGGHILRALLAGRIGRARATRAAAAIGTGVAVAFGFLGLWSGNLLLIVVAVFLYSAAADEARDARLRGAIETHRVRDVMREFVTIVDPEMTLAEVARTMRAHGRREVVVQSPGRPPLGAFTTDDLTAVDPARLSRLQVGSLGSTLARRALRVSPDESLATAVENAEDAGASTLIATHIEAGSGLTFVVGLVSLSTLDDPLALAALTAGPSTTPGHRRVTSRPASGTVS